MEDYVKSFFPETQPIKTQTDYEIVRVITENIVNGNIEYNPNINAELEYKRVIQWAEDLGINLEECWI